MADYRLIKDMAEMVPFLERIQDSPVIAVDTETTGLDPHENRVRLLQIAVPKLPVMIIDCDQAMSAGPGIIKKLLSGQAVKVFQNAKFDLKFLQAMGVEVSLPLFDTMLAGLLLKQSGGAERVGLAALVKHFLHDDFSKEEQHSNWCGVISESQIEYAARDAAVLIPLREAMVPLLKSNGMADVARLEFACVRALAQIEYNGIRLDKKCWQDLYDRSAAEKKRALDRMYEYVGRPAEQQTFFGDEVPIGPNPDSNQQIIEWLKEQGILVEDTSRHTLSEYISHPFVAAIIQYRHATKAISSFLSTFPSQIHPVTQRLHPRYSQVGAWSGRMSCSKPNIQQIPREFAFRACFLAPPGRKLIMADYSQIELRVAAEISGDERMIDAYRQGADLHRLTASLITGIPLEQITAVQRQAAKAVNFGLIYGMGARGLQAYARETYGTEMTEGEAVVFRNKFFEAYAGISRWHQSLRNLVSGEARTLSGRKHVFTENSGLSIRTNIPVQGGAADILKQALGTLVDDLGDLDATMVAVVHDEIILEAAVKDVENAAELLQKAMEKAGAHYLQKVPVCADVKIGDHWGSK